MRGSKKGSLIGCQEEICGHLNEVLEKSAVYTEDFMQYIQRSAFSDNTDEALIENILA